MEVIGLFSRKPVVYTLIDLKRIYDNEQLLVILLCRLYFNIVTKEEVDTFVQTNTIDHTRFYHLVRLHGISAFIYHVTDKCQIEIEKNVAEKLRGKYLVNMAGCMEQLVISSRLQQSLQRKGITVIPYKGVGFSHNYYGNIGLRESSDLDFIIRGKDAGFIENHLVQIGYKPKTTVPSAYKEYYHKNFKDISYSAPAYTRPQGFSTEMHWRLLNSHYGDFERYDYFKNGIIYQQIGPLPFVSLNPHYDLVAVASNHFVKDICIKFKYILDIASLLHTKGDKVDVQSLVYVYKKNGFQKRMEYGLFLVEALLGQQLPCYNNRFFFSPKHLKHSLEYKLIKIKISSGAFLKRSLQLQDNNYFAFSFLIRCMYYYILPMASDIPVKAKYPIPLLILFRLLRSARKVLLRSFGHWKKRQAS